MVECGEGLTHYFGTLLRSNLKTCIVVTDNNLLEDSLSLSSANFSMNTEGVAEVAYSSDDFKILY
jgi:hypothetical protein